MKTVVKVALCVAAVVVSGCGKADSARDAALARSLTIASWNMQALFDEHDAGNEYTEYRAAAGWNAEKYEARLVAAARAAEKLVEGGSPDMIAFVEVENSRVAEHLAQKMEKFHYNYHFFTGNEGYSLGVALVSRLPPVSVKTHSTRGDAGLLPRPIAEARFEAGGSPFTLFICHWKSKLGGEEKTEAGRREAARLIGRRAAALRAECPGMPILVLGDLNENHDEFSRRGGAALTALLPDTEEAAALVSDIYNGTNYADFADFFVLSGEKPPAARHFADFPFEPAVFYTPWERELSGGSFFYQNSPDTIDHFLLDGGFFDGAGWEFGAAYVARDNVFTNSRGEAATYNPRTGSGLSDHLPIVLVLELAEGYAE